MEKHCLLVPEERTNFDVLDYIQRKTLLGGENQEIGRILVEWGEVRIGDGCSMALLKLQMLTNLTQAAAEGKTQRREKPPQTGASENREQFNQIKLGRLIVNTEVYPCMKRACVALDALRHTRISNLQSKGIERKTHMEVYDKETKGGKQDLIHGKLEQMIDTSSKVAWLNRRQYEEWRETEKLEKRRTTEEAGAYRRGERKK